MQACGDCVAYVPDLGMAKSHHGPKGAVRAAGSACGANPLAVVVPCHRVLRTGGGPGGYAWGLERKAALNERERG